MGYITEKLKSEPIIAIVIGAFIVRLPLIFYSGSMHLPDERLYHRLAKAIISGAGYATSKGPTLYRPPLYSGFLAAVYSITGPEPVVAVFIQAALSAVTCYFIYRLTLDLWDKRTALIAAVFWAVGPDMVIFSKLLMTETLFLFLAGLLLWGLVSYKGTWKSSVIIGVVAGLSALTRPAVLAFLPFALVWLVWTGRANAVKTLVIIGVCAVVIAPWTIRNYAVTGSFRLIDTTGGINLYAGNHYRGKGEWYFPRGNHLADRSLTEVERDELAYKETLKNARDHPIQTLRVIGLKAAYVIFPSGEKLYLSKGTAPPALLWIILSGLFFEALALGAAAYLALTEKKTGAGVLLWYVITGAAVLVAVVFGERYRMSGTYPALVPLAAAGWAYLSGKGNNRRKAIAVAILIAAQFAAGVYILLFRPNMVERTLFFLHKIT